MDPDRTPLNEELTTTEDDRSQNTKITHQLERGPEEITDQDSSEVQGYFELERDLEEDSNYYNIVDAEDIDLREEGLPKGPGNKVEHVKDFLIDQLGYDPDVEDYATFGNIEVFHNNGAIDVFYELGENLSSPQGLTAPLVQNAEPEILEHVIAGEVPHAVTTGYEREGKNGLHFRYREQDWIMATEEVGDAIAEFEEELDLSSYSGR